jgi:hypothetical protein
MAAPALRIVAGHGRAPPGRADVKPQASTIAVQAGLVRSVEPGLGQWQLPHFPPRHLPPAV